MLPSINAPTNAPNKNPEKTLFLLLSLIALILAPVPNMLYSSYDKLHWINKGKYIN